MKALPVLPPVKNVAPPAMLGVAVPVPNVAVKWKGMDVPATKRLLKI